MPTKLALTQIIHHFSLVSDPRRRGRRLHLLVDIIVISICAVICGAEHWTEIERFGKCKKKWFKSFLKLPNGIPSHDTFGRTFAKLNPVDFQKCFLNWIQELKKVFGSDIVSIDGKTLRNSFDTASKRAAIHMVSAWSSKNACVLAQTKVEEKSNEITAVPKLLEILELEDCVVTMDAMGCQKKHAGKIIEKGADYILALKGNQGKFHEEVVDYCKDAVKSGFGGLEVPKIKKTEKGHGRIETREWFLIKDLSWAKKSKNWPGIKSIGIAKTTRKMGQVKSEEVRYFCTSLTNVKEFAKGVRNHWNIENQLHWVLDVAFREDKCRIRKDNAAENFAILRHIALNKLKRENTLKLGIKSKRLSAGWDNEYLLRVLIT